MNNQKIQRNFYLARLVTEQLAGTISPEHHRELEEWLEQSEANRLMYQDLCLELAKTAIQPLPEVDTGKGWECLQKKQGQQSKRKLVVRLRRWGVAAAVLVLLGSGFFSYFFFGFADRQQPLQITRIVPGSTRAQLILAGGEVINLEKTGCDRDLTPEPGVTIRMDSGKVTYTVVSEMQEQVTGYNTLSIPRGGEYVLQLCDGTKVWLNSATVLKYPSIFSGKQRQVELDGEAYFEVTHNPDVPFIVKTATTAVQVYGTSFNVYAYHGDDNQHTTLLSGSVGVCWQGQEVRLEPGEQAVWDVRTNEMAVRQVNALNFCSWHTGSFIFENSPLREVLDRLARWYDVEVFYVNPEVGDLHFTGDLNRYDDFEKILKFLEMTRKVQFTVNGKTIWVGAK